MSIKRWQPGEVIIQEDWIGRSPSPYLVDVRPHIVVQDTPELLAIVSIPGTTWLTRDIPGRTSMTADQRIDIYLSHRLAAEWYERTVSGAVLTLQTPDTAHSIKLFWDAHWDLRFWYVNLEPHYARTARGIRVDDYTLDIVATPDLKWSWKDEPEFEALCRAGHFSDELARSIRAEGESVIKRIEARAWPFNEPWPDWRPDPSWQAPKVADLWSPPS